MKGKETQRDRQSYRRRQITSSSVLYYLITPLLILQHYSSHSRQRSLSCNFLPVNMLSYFLYAQYSCCYSTSCILLQYFQYTCTTVVHPLYLMLLQCFQYIWYSYSTSQILDATTVLPMYLVLLQYFLDTRSYYSTSCILNTTIQLHVCVSQCFLYTIYL